MDLNFHSILYDQDRNYSVIEPGVRKYKYLKDVESIFTEFSTSDTLELYERAECVTSKLSSIMSLISLSCREKKDHLLKKRLEKVKWIGKKLQQIPMTISRVPNVIKTVIFNEYTFPLDSAIFADIIDEKTQEYPMFWNASDLKRVKSATYDSNNNVFIAQYHEKIPSNQQNLFIEQHKNYFTDWLNSLGNRKA